MQGVLRSLLVATVSATAFAVPAAAQDTAEERPFNGFYVGVSGGYDVQGNDVGSIIEFDRNGDNQFGEQVSTTTGANAFATGFCNGRARDARREPTACENDRNRGSYYGKIGFDIQRGPFVIGAVGEFGRTETVDYVSGFSTTPANYVFSRSVDWEASARLRAGFAANTTLFYATGGGGYARIDHGFTSTNTANTFTASVDDTDRKGFIVGGGLEQKIGRNLSIGLEYTYHDYKDDDFKIEVGRGTAPATNPFVLPPNTAGTSIRRSDPNFRWHSLRAQLNFRF